MTAPTTDELIEKLRRRDGLSNVRMDEHGSTYYCAIPAYIDQAATRLAELEHTEHRVCDGCGTSHHESEFAARGPPYTCCPERKMLTAKEWYDRATAAESRVAELEREREELRATSPDNAIVGELMEMFADPAIEKLTFRAAREIAYQEDRAIRAETALAEAREVMEEITSAAEQLPRRTPAPGGCFTEHPFQISAGVVWTNDRACARTRAFLAALDKSEAEEVK